MLLHVALKDIKREKEPINLTHFPLHVSFYSRLVFYHRSLFFFPQTHRVKHAGVHGSVAFDLSRRVSSMAHFHKSHVSVFVARGTLTRGRSPNTERIKKNLNTLPTHSADRLDGHIHQRREEVGKKCSCGDERRKCFVI